MRQIIRRQNHLLYRKSYKPSRVIRIRPLNRSTKARGRFSRRFLIRFPVP